MALLRRRSEPAAESGTAGAAEPAVPSVPHRAGSPFRRWGSRQSPRLVPDFGDPELAALRAAAEAGDWPAMRGVLTGVPDGHDLSWLVANATETPGMETWLGDAVSGEPGSALPLLVRGARQAAWAWEARTAAPAEHVSREQFEVFHERLADAEETLYEAAELEPAWSAPWYFLLITGRGLQVGQDIARLRFEAAVRRCPGHLGAHRQMLQQLCRKWGGSHEEMHAFARRSMLDAPHGSPLAELVAVAHLEEWLDLDHGADAQYMRQRKVAAELRDAAGRSYLHPDFAPGRDALGVLNTFAMAFSLADLKADAREAFARIDGRVTEFPWRYLGGDPVKAFRACRSSVGR